MIPHIQLPDEGDNLRAISMITRREIEARVIAPLMEAFAQEMGIERTVEIAGRVIRQIAHEQGCQLAKSLGGCTLAHFAKLVEAWGKDDALQMEIIEQDENRLHFNVTRCRYAELYKNLGIPQLGKMLSCNRDEALIEGFNPAIKLHRAHTIMEGAAFCDFRFNKT
ncbi:MAG: L-2-amino-thiazoline-4-carboxylic acid hydrolase [Anaerolineales bacterium]|nr:L-2-amino-thiazoline-4-carboxylic acid hydrolase [Anaerolineales bacterium]